MNKTDIIWQNAVDGEKMRLAARSVEELLAMEFFTSSAIEVANKQVALGIWHEAPDFRPALRIHSFILIITRGLIPLLPLYRKYLAGFSINEHGVIVDIPDEVLYSYD